MLQFLKVTFDTATGLLSDLTNLETGQSIKLKQNFYWSVPDICTNMSPNVLKAAHL